MLVSIYERFRPDRVLIEEVGFQKVLRTLLLAKARSRGLAMPITTAEIGMGKNKRPKDKMTRLLQVQPLFSNRAVEIVSKDVRDELLSFPHGDYDDLVDVAVYALYRLPKSTLGSVIRPKQELRLKTRSSFFVEEVRPGVLMTKTGEPPIKNNTKFFKLW